MMKKIYLMLCLCLMTALQVVAQEIVVKGKVTDAELNEGLPGVTVIIEGTSMGTITDVDGNYVIEVNDLNQTLVFSFIGMETTKVPIAGRSVLDIALETSDQILDEIMVVAYGTTSKKAFTGAAEVVDSKVLEARPVSSFEKALQGTTAGLQITSSSGQPGASSTVRIRGIGSLSAGSSPLYIVDGVPMTGGISNLNPNDIESLTVLKDASASSLYGSRAANGVIVVTTKQGDANQTKISFDSQLGISSRISEGIPLMNSSQFYLHSWRGLQNRGLEDGMSLSESVQYAHDNVEQIVGFNPFGVQNPIDDGGNIIQGTQVLTDTDWRDLVYKTGYVQNYNLSVSGGMGDSKIYFSLGYFNDSGTVIGSDFERVTGMLNVSHKINNFISAGMNTRLSFSSFNSPPNGTEGANPVRSAEIINAATPLRNGDGSYNFTNTAVFDFNPVALSEMDIYKGTIKNGSANAFLDFRVAEDLIFTTRGFASYSSSGSLQYYNPFNGNGAGVNGRSTQSVSEAITWNVTNLLTWSKSLNESNIEILIGQEATGSSSEILAAGVTDFGVNGKPYLVWGSEPSTPASDLTENGLMSYLSQIKYDFDEKYYLSASIRQDASSRFGKNNKRGLFYSAGASWRITEEDWFRDMTWLNDLKLRASYGTSGNNSIGNYASLGLYGGGYNYGGSPGLAPVQLANENLQWEKIASFNMGVDFQIKERINGSIEYYERKSDGLIYNKPLSIAKGFTSISTNLGAMKNSGFELTVDADVVRGANLIYNVGFNISTNANEILYIGQDRILSGTKILEKGGDLYQFYMKEWAGVNPDTGEPMWFTNETSDDVEEQGEPASAYQDPLGSKRMVTSEYNDAERIRLGSALPDFYGGISNRLSYKGIELSFYFYYNIGGQVYNSDYATNMHDGTSPGSNLSVDALKSWTPNNRFTNVPKYVTNNQSQSTQQSSRFLQDASFLRLKNITISYNLSQSICERLRVQNVRVYASGENLLTWTNYDGFDPEGAINGTTNGNIPGVKVFNIGLKLDM